MAPDPGGRLAQLVEHLVYTERVGGSSPSPPTNDSTASTLLSCRELRQPCRVTPRTAQPMLRTCGAERAAPRLRLIPAAFQAVAHAGLIRKTGNRRTLSHRHC